MVLFLSKVKVVFAILLLLGELTGHQVLSWKKRVSIVPREGATCRVHFSPALVTQPFARPGTPEDLKEDCCVYLAIFCRSAA